MSLPLKGELFAKLIEHLRLAQEASANMAHLSRDDSTINANGWLAVSEGLKKTQHLVTLLATKGRLN